LEYVVKARDEKYWDGIKKACDEEGEFVLIYEQKMVKEVVHDCFPPMFLTVTIGLLVNMVIRTL